MTHKLHIVRKTISIILFFFISSANAVVGGSVVIMNHGIHGTKITIVDKMNRILGYKKFDNNEVRYFDASHRYLGKCIIKDSKEMCFDYMNRRVSYIEFPK